MVQDSIRGDSSKVRGCKYIVGLVTGLVEGGETCFGSGKLSSSLSLPVGQASSLLLFSLVRVDFSIGWASLS